MKVLLILYPINQYVDFLIGRSRLPRAKERAAKLYQRLINKRYPGFQRILVLFSDSRNLAKPYTPQLWKGINITSFDIVCSAGVTYNDFRHKGQQPKYADILALCPKPIEKLVVGGFHLWSCVNEFSERAYHEGLNVVVDEDLTDLFFYMIKGPKGGLSLQIPICIEASLERKKQRLKEARLLGHARRIRKDKPWLTPI